MMWIKLKYTDIHMVIGMVQIPDIPDIPLSTTLDKVRVL